MALAAAAPVAAGAKRIAVVCGAGEPLQLLRRSLLPEIAGRGHRILVVAPEFTAADIHALDGMDAERTVFAGHDSGFKLLADWKAIGALKTILTGWAPHTVFGCGAKTMIYAALAARGAGAERVVLLADTLPENRFTGTLAADEMPAWRYSQAMRAADEAIFCNRDDLGLLKRLGIVPSGLRTEVVAGGGIDLQSNGAIALPPLDDGLVFLMVAELDRRRGVIEYCEAARDLRERAPHCRFLLAGSPGEGSLGLAAEDILAFAPAVEYLGPAQDIRSLLNLSHVFVYPSHGEGMPQPVLEAMAAGRPIVTTDVAGCRDTVDDRVNGCFAEPRDARSLATAMESFLKRPDLIPSIARASRAKAERFCSIDTVNRSLLTALALA
jgi:glycosyltransferase involved in cell wall biosynthesis